MVKIAPSILAADFTKLAEEITAIEKAGADIIHLDVMDGHFVPNLTFGLPIIKQIRKITDLPFDVHLMVTNPEDFFKPLAEIGVQYISFHPETVYHAHRQINLIKEYGIKAGIVLNPGTSLSYVDSLIQEVDFILLMSVNPGFGGQKFITSTFSKLTKLEELREKHNPQMLIEIDGGVNNLNAHDLVAGGADMLVAGSYVFNGNYREQINSLRE